MSTRKIEKDDSSRLEHVLRVGMNSMAISGFGPDRSTEFQMPQTMGDDLKDEFVAIEPPPQVNSTKNYDFYNESFKSSGKGNEITLKQMAKAIKDGYTLSSGTGWDNVVLRTRRDTLVGKVNYWNTLLDSNKNLTQIGQGSFNKVFLMDPGFLLSNRIKQEFGDALQTGGKNAGKIVIRLGKLKPDEDEDEDEENIVTRTQALKELYIGGYASYYGIGPVILSSYYKIRPEEREFANAGYEESLSCRLEMTMTAIVAWDGDCLQMLIPKTLGPNGKRRTLQSNRVARFCIRYVELLIKAAHVGLFHGDTKLENMLYTMNKNEKGEPDVDSMKICMTDFDSEFCVLMPPKERACHNKECIIVACVCMLLGHIRCAYGDNTWRPIKEAMRETLARTLLATDNCIMPNDANTLCQFLQNSMYIQREQQVYPRHFAGDAKQNEPDYSGQMLLVSENFQVNTGHYMQIRMAEAQWNNNEKYCMLLTKHDSLFEKVVSYALEETPQMLLERETTKRKRDSNDSSARPTRRVAR